MKKVLQNYVDIVDGIHDAMLSLINDLKSSSTPQEVIEKVEKSEKSFKALEKAIATTQRGIKIKFELEEKKDALDAVCSNYSDQIKPEDFEIIIRAAKQFGLLKPDIDDSIDKIVQNIFERGQPIKIH